MKVHDIQQKLKGIGTINSVKRFLLGAINDIYLLKTDQGAYALRLYKTLPVSQIRIIVDLLNNLKGLPVPHLIRIDGEHVFRIEGRWGFLYRYIRGRNLTRYTSSQLQEVGEFLGRFHEHGKQLYWRGPVHKFYHFTPKKVDEVVVVSRNANLPYIDLLPKITDALQENMLSDDLSSGPIHVDVKPENVLFEGGKLSGVLDFDNAYIGPFVLDLAKSMVWFGRGNRTFNSARAIEIYRGYMQIRKLTKPEYYALYKAVKYAFLSHIFMDYWMCAVGRTDRSYFHFIMTDFYASFTDFRMSEDQFYKLLK